MPDAPVNVIYSLLVGVKLPLESILSITKVQGLAALTFDRYDEISSFRTIVLAPVAKVEPSCFCKAFCVGVLKTPAASPNDGDGLIEADTLADGDIEGLTEGLTEAEGDKLGLIDGDIDADGIFNN